MPWAREEGSTMSHLHPLFTLPHCSPSALAAGALSPGPGACPALAPAVRQPPLGLDFWLQGPGAGAGRAEGRG